MPEINNGEDGASIRQKLNDLFTDSSAYVTLTGTQTLTNKTLTTPQINDGNGTNQYVFSSSVLAADRTVILPLLIAGDTFVFENHIQTLTNKTLTAPVINSPTGIVKGDVGLGNVDNTSDLLKPLSTDTIAAIAASASFKQDKNSADTLNWTIFSDNAAQTINSITQNKNLCVAVPVAPIAYTFSGAGSTFPIGGELIVFNDTGGQDITLTAGGGVTIIYNGTLTATVAATKMARMLRVTATKWIRIS